MSKKRIELISVDELIPYARNAKMHDAAQVASIAGSIKEFGFNNPVLVDKDGGIIAGHGRVLAARKLGMEKVDCIRLSHLTENQKRAYIIADNRLAETGGGWDRDMLQVELQEIDWSDIHDFALEDFGDFCPVGDVIVDRPDGMGRAANSPWARIGEASAGVVFAFGAVQKRLPDELYTLFASKVDMDNLEEKINEMCNL